MHKITQDEIKELFHYKNSQLYWNSRPARAVDISKPAGGIDVSTGYWRIMIGGKTYGAHRLIFIMHYGCIPEIIDHINGDKSDNRLQNLRTATQAENSRNAKLSKDNESGFKGVGFCKRTQRWRGRIMLNKKAIFVGSFIKLDDAVDATIKLREKLHGIYANNG